MYSKELTIENIYDVSEGFDYIILTCPLDSFLQKDSLKRKESNLNQSIIRPVKMSSFG